MSSRFADLLMFALLTAVAGVVIWQSYGLPNPFGGSIGSGGFPTMMAVIAVVLCAIGALRSLIGPSSEQFEIKGLRKMLVTLAAMFAFFVLWQVIGNFFWLAFVFLSGLLCFYASDQTLTRRLVLLNVAGSAIVLVLIKLFFTYVLYVRF